MSSGGEPYGSTFEQLRDLQRFLLEIRQQQKPSLERYYDAASGGFYHRRDEYREGDFSKSSTATCILSLAATGQWKEDPWASKAQDLARAMLKVRWKSAGLPPDNPFTTAFMVEAITILAESDPAVARLSARFSRRFKKGEDRLVDEIKDGAALIGDYPQSAYVTQLAVRALRRRSALPNDIADQVQKWAWGEIARQMALRDAKSKSSDLFQMAYAIIMAGSLGELASATPDQNLMLQTALAELFAGQLDDGSWPRSRPLFHYPGVGSAYCYEYEMLVQLLQEPRLESLLLQHLGPLSNAASALRATAFDLGHGAMAWSSGHHPQFRGPESWSTASVFHFAHALDRLLSEAIRRAIFKYLDAAYKAPTSPHTAESEFAPGFLDADVWVDGGPRSLRDAIYRGFVRPIVKESESIRNGASLSGATPMSAIFYGPPGTSKTELARHIADFLGWPLLTVNPSHFLSKGIDQILAVADRIFTMLASAERIVVLLDEFDEMVRERATSPEALSRFLTTAMLPKLAEINRTRRIVFIVATNHIEHFDFAISRPGRFDVVLQIMPPSAHAKVERWPSLKKAAQLADDKAALLEQIDLLTFDESSALATRLTGISDPGEAGRLIDEASNNATLNMLYSEAESTTGQARTQGRARRQASRTWAQVCSDQRQRTRLARLPPTS